MKKILAALAVVGLVTGGTVLIWPAPATALGGSELEINFYQCPPNHTSLGQCTETGWVYRDCHNTNIVEGTQGNYKVTHQESCRFGGGSTTCAELVIVNGQPAWYQASCT